MHPRPAVDAGRAWLAELVLRAVDGVPPVGEDEFAELAGWVRANEGWLAGLAGEDGLVGIGGGEGVSIADLVAGIGRGPRSPGAGEVAEVFRQLRSQYEHVPVSAVDGARR